MQCRPFIFDGVSFFVGRVKANLMWAFEPTMQNERRKRDFIFCCRRHCCCCRSWPKIAILFSLPFRTHSCILFTHINFGRQEKSTGFLVQQKHYIYLKMLQCLSLYLPYSHSACVVATVVALRLNSCVERVRCAQPFIYWIDSLFSFRTYN